MPLCDSHLYDKLVEVEEKEVREGRGNGGSEGGVCEGVREGGGRREESGKSE